MTFTDEDLKRLKDEVNRGIVTIERDGERIDEVLEGLIARLEAAEKVVHTIVSSEDGFTESADTNQALTVWRKAAGK